LLIDFKPLRSLGRREVESHRLPRGFLVVLADRAIDIVMLLGRIFEIRRAIDVFASILEVYLSDHIHQGSEYAITGCGRDRLVKLHVVDKVLLGTLDRRIHSRDLFGELRHLLTCRSLGGEGGDAHLESDTGLEHFVGREPVESGKQF
jgi:hypothetical protein